MRLPVLIIAAILGLGLFCGSASAKQLWLPTIDNPYCAITTYLLPDLSEQALSTMDNDHPIIVLSAMTMTQSAAYGRFLMAHECSITRLAMSPCIDGNSAISALSPSSTSRRS